MPLDPKDAFLHVIYDYRYLALAGSGWDLYGHGGAAQAQAKANEVLPGIGVVLLDSLLLHARLLIDFYTKPSTNRWPTDILLSDFDGLAIDNVLSGNLLNYKKPVEVHVLHLTAWRDTAHRAGNTVFARPDWNTEAAPLVKLILDALQDAAGQAATASSKWEKPLKDLHAAATSLLGDPDFKWPDSLAEKPDVTAYLAAQCL
jgi:hypothetical protein